MEQLQILWVGRSQTDIGLGVKTHRHPYYQMFYIQGGDYKMTLDGKAFHYHAGQCILVPPDVSHGYENCGSTPLKHLEIKFTLHRAALETRIRSVNSMLSEDPLLGALFERIINEFSDLGSLADDAAAAYLRAILHVFTAKERYAETPSFRFIDAAALSPLSQRIIRYLEEHYAEDVTLDDVAEALGYNKSYLCVAFRRDTMTTILDCLNTIRIRRAAELITYSDHSLTQVAALCGYRSVSHFNRVFLKYVGTTPGQCRRAYPVDILFNPEQIDRIGQPGRFMYNVLAHKRITPEMIRSCGSAEE